MSEPDVSLQQKWIDAELQRAAAEFAHRRIVRDRDWWRRIAYLLLLLLTLALLSVSMSSARAEPAPAEGSITCYAMGTDGSMTPVWSASGQSFRIVRRYGNDRVIVRQSGREVEYPLNLNDVCVTRAPKKADQ